MKRRLPGLALIAATFLAAQPLDAQRPMGDMPGGRKLIRLIDTKSITAIPVTFGILF